MACLDVFKGQNSIRYIGVPVSLKLVTGETVTGRIHCVDLSKWQAVILKSIQNDTLVLTVIKSPSIEAIEIHGEPRNNSEAYVKLGSHALEEFRDSLSKNLDNFFTKRVENHKHKHLNRT